MNILDLFWRYIILIRVFHIPLLLSDVAKHCRQVVHVLAVLELHHVAPADVSSIVVCRDVDAVVLLPTEDSE